ncbi:MAG: hypothetical protein ACOYNY_09090 [Caldilineaceae bacterium]
MTTGILLAQAPIHSSFQWLVDEVVVGELHALGVHFLNGSAGQLKSRIQPVALLAGLATSNNARVQLALIPLLLV